jgi:ABC-type antimicrobial peptide transport system permease subunit
MFASRFFPNEDPIGRHFGRYAPGHANDYEIVGVVADAKYDEASRPERPMFFIPLTQTVRYDGEIQNKIEESSRYVGSIELFVHGDPDAMTPQIRAVLADVDPNLSPKKMTTFRELIQTTTSQRTLTARLSDAFGVIALVLAAVGLYGVTAYRVARRTHELGLRMALGASRGHIASLVIRGACSQTAIGLVLGIPLALAAARALQSQLFGVSPFNVPILLASTALVVICALAASALPARRAASIAPMAALRSEG